MGVIEGNDQLQIVLGPGKAQTASEMMNILLAQNHASQEIEAKPADLHTLAAANKQQLKSKQRSGFHSFLTQFATIFTPLIPVLSRQACYSELPLYYSRHSYLRGAPHLCG